MCCANPGLLLQWASSISTKIVFFFIFNNIYLIFNFQKYNIDRKNKLNSVFNKVAKTQENLHNKANTKLKIK